MRPQRYRWILSKAKGEQKTATVTSIRGWQREWMRHKEVKRGREKEVVNITSSSGMLLDKPARLIVISPSLHWSNAWIEKQWHICLWICSGSLAFNRRLHLREGVTVYSPNVCQLHVYTVCLTHLTVTSNTHHVIYNVYYTSIRC